MEKINIVLYEEIINGKLKNQINKVDPLLLVEIVYNKDTDDYKINKTGINNSHNFREAQDIYNISYGYILSENHLKINGIEDHLLIFVKNQRGNYDCKEKLMKIFEKPKKEVFNGIYLKDINQILPFELYTIEETLEGFKIESLLVYEKHLSTYESDHPNKNIIFKIPDKLGVYGIYGNYVKTFIKNDKGTYQSIEVEKEAPVKVYKKS